METTITNTGYGFRIQADDYFALRRIDAGDSLHIGYVSKTIDTQTWYWGGLSKKSRQQIKFLDCFARGRARRYVGCGL